GLSSGNPGVPIVLSQESGALDLPPPEPLPAPGRSHVSRLSYNYPGTFLGGHRSFPEQQQWSLRDEAHAERFLATADHLRTAGQLVDVAVGPEGDVGPPPHVPLPPGATLRGWRALLTFAYGGTVPQGSEKEVEEAAQALGAPRVVATCAPRLESEGGPKPLEEQWETLRAMEQLHASGLGCDLQLRAGDEVIPGELGVGVPQEWLRRGTGRSGTARSPGRDAGA
uniref:Uncharacterized protein n=1 Tax=Strix occidentalis caurina TaxID=311401 RepID=A0A8D0FSD5_STROC